MRPIQCATLVPPWHPLHWHRKRQNKHTPHLRKSWNETKKSSLRFRSFLGTTKKTPYDYRADRFRPISGSHFQLEVEKRHPGIKAKIDTEKVSENVAIEANRQNGTRNHILFQFVWVRRTILRIEGCRNLCKSMKHACGNWVRNRYAEFNENETKMEPTWNQ